MPAVKFRRLHAKAIVPQYMTSGSAGCDVTACLDQAQTVSPGERVALSTGLAFEIPSGFEIQVRPRSGLAFKKGLTVINAPGTIDSDYRGEVKVLMVNLGQENVEVLPGDRIAQLVLQRVETIEWQETLDLSATERAAGGFGSTGVSA